MATPAEALGLSPQLLARLRGLALQNRMLHPGPGAGRRRSPRAGSSVELMDYRNYTPGDDFRRLDWNVYARLERLFLRVYRAEENLLVRVLLDTSASMGFGEPSKLQFAKAMAGALAYVALAGYDRVVVAGCGGAPTEPLPPGSSGSRLTAMRPTSGEHAAARVWEFLTRLEAHGTADLDRALAEAGRTVREPGLTVVLTDALYPGACQRGLKSLLEARQEVALLQVLAPDELDPDLTGDWRLRDAENPDHHVEVTLTPAHLQAYRRRLEEYTAELSGFCRSNGILFSQVSSSMPVDEALFGLWRASGLVKGRIG